MTDENVVLDVPSTEEKAQHYKAMGDSVDLINVMSGEQWLTETDEEKKDCVKRNVEHLKIMVAKEWWGDEDMTPANKQSLMQHHNRLTLNIKLYKENKMAKNTKTTIKTPITIDDTEYHYEDMTPEQQTMVNHVADLDKKINGTRFNLDQLMVGKDAFVNLLKVSLETKTKG
jgi:hypothetical protein